MTTNVQGLSGDKAATNLVEGCIGLDFRPQWIGNWTGVGVTELKLGYSGIWKKLNLRWEHSKLEIGPQWTCQFNESFPTFDLKQFLLENKFVDVFKTVPPTLPLLLIRADMWKWITRQEKSHMYLTLSDRTGTYRKYEEKNKILHFLPPSYFVDAQCVLGVHNQGFGIKFVTFNL